MRDDRTTPADGRKLVGTGQPGIYKRGSRYVVVWQHRGKQHKSFHRTLGEAKAAQGLRRQPGYRRPASRRPFGEYAADWLRTYNGRTARGLALSTRAAYTRDLHSRICPFFKNYRMADIGAPEVCEFVEQLEGEGLATASIKKVLAPLKALFATAVQHGVVPFNPTIGIRVRQHEQQASARSQRPIPLEHTRALLAALPERERLLCMLLAATGVRISEALGLEWSDVELGARPQIHIRRQYYRGEPKQLKTSASRRTLPLPTDLARELWKAKGTAVSGPVFRTRDGRRLSDRNVRRVLRRASNSLGLAPVGFHAFRHTFASKLYADCKDIRKVSAWLGHSDPAFTLRTYIHLVDDDLGEAPDWGLHNAA
jgi:integrase